MTWAAAEAIWSYQELGELHVTITAYNMVSRFLRAVRLEPSPA